jgi:hypothetical protein
MRETGFEPATLGLKVVCGWCVSTTPTDSRPAVSESLKPNSSRATVKRFRWL